MFKQLSDWIDSRTGYKGVLHEALDEPIPGGARWRYVFGSALTGTFAIQLVTGLLLMTTYSPSATTAWGSVYYINQQMALGWFLRGIHHFGSQAMIVLLLMHVAQVLLAGAYRAPREVNWWFGMALLMVTLGFSLTGYLLPWDQKGYWATKVATNIMGSAPVLGPYIQKVVVGGPDYGNQTLTRFYGLHVGLLPAALVACLAVHVALFRKHGVTAPKKAQGMGKFWPEQVFMDTVGTVAVLGILAFLVLREGGANLDAPADPSSDYPARPEWYFLSLFQLLKLFPGEREIIGTMVVPTAILVVLFALPLLDRVIPHRLAHFLACALVFSMVGGAGYLTYQAVKEDYTNEEFQTARSRADDARRRALQLASSPEVGIPPSGASYLLRTDPYYHGRAVLEAKCLGCHHFGGKGQVTRGNQETNETTPQFAADLKDFGTKDWVRGLLDRPDSPEYFGKVPQAGGMTTWKKGSKLSGEELDAVADFVASFASIPADVSPEEWLNDPAANVAEHPGLEPFLNECGECHVVGESGLLTEGGTMEAPNLFAYGSPRWIARMIRKPGAPDLYDYIDPPTDRMPAFADQLTDNDLETLVRYLRNDYLEPTGPEPDRPGPRKIGRGD